VDARWLDPILARPDDDEPRLVYADALMERGDPRGELIRVQCALARHDASDGDVGDVGRLRSRERALLKAHHATWTATLPRTILTSFLFRRGFLEELVGSGDAFATITPARAEQAPLLRALSVGSGGRVGGLFANPDAAILESLSIHAPSDETIAALAASPHLPRLRRFAMEKAFLDGASVGALVSLPQPLEELHLGFDGRISSAGNFVKQLTTCPARATLRRLTVTQLRHLSPLGDAAAALASLEQLTLENADLERAAMMKLAANLPRLQSLDVSENYSSYDLEALDAAALLAALPSLRWLRLNKLGLGDRQAIALAESPDASRLTRLDLGRNRIGDAGALALARSPHLARLRRLNLNANALSDGAKRAIREAFPRATIQLR